MVKWKKRLAFEEERSAMKQDRTACARMLLHGAGMESGGCRPELR